MYKLTVYNLRKEMISEDVIPEYPSNELIEERTKGLSGVFIDICRVGVGAPYNTVELDHEIDFILEEFDELTK